MLDRLRLPSTKRVGEPAQADAAVMQDTLASGPHLEELKSRIREGMGLLLILGGHTAASAVEELTDGAVRQTGVIEVAPGAERSQQLEQKAATIRYVGPTEDRLASAIGWVRQPESKSDQ